MAQKEQNRKRLFRTSMYFFVPLQDIEEVHKGYFDNKQPGDEINIPDYVRTNDGIVAVPCPEPTDKEQMFVFKGSNGNYEIDLKLHQLKFSPDKDDSKAKYFLVLGAEIDQQAKLTNGSTRDFTELDIIELKKAFFQHKADKVNGWALTRQMGGMTIPEFLKDKLGKIDKGKWDNPRLMYALVDVRGVSGEKDESIDFDTKYYRDDLQHIEKVLGETYTAFAYGLLHTHDNYEALDPVEIKQALPHPVAELISERFYAIHGNMVSLRTHYPFKDKEKAYTENLKLPFNFNALPNIYEMCRTIITEQSLNEYEQKADEENDGKLRKTISEIIAEMSRNCFNVKVLDDKMKFIYKAWGFYERRDNIIQMSDQHATAIEEKRNYLPTLWGCLIAFMGFIVTVCSVYLAWHSSGNPNHVGNCNCSCEQPVEHTLQLALSTGDGLQTVVLLLIIILCIIAIIAMTIRGYRESKQ